MTRSSIERVLSSHMRYQVVGFSDTNFTNSQRQITNADYTYWTALISNNAKIRYPRFYVISDEVYSCICLSNIMEHPQHYSTMSYALFGHV